MGVSAPARLGWGVWGEPKAAAGEEPAGGSPGEQLAQCPNVAVYELRRTGVHPKVLKTLTGSEGSGAAQNQTNSGPVASAQPGPSNGACMQAVSAFVMTIFLLGLAASALMQTDQDNHYRLLMCRTKLMRLSMSSGCQARARVGAVRTLWPGHRGGSLEERLEATWRINSAGNSAVNLARAWTPTIVETELKHRRVRTSEVDDVMTGSLLGLRKP